ncbi:C40 family peptidase [Actinacidiphila bryophytorum]|uniref:Cell wall-associated hydrolase, NlpC family n=1 Tax=Actinacidiphila bryophytorum TaxID=1436133 RepID=A0A9W4DYK4_9ACTN|nr:C40 family peptidase [Actinacidiphila bryophytorum]MBM9436537.1 C40 family peptidase [Actinacidiphila bryophytorum]MBN6542280.1 C40 family peptidase [Actinacidiphila bryophytorum]CAG7600413.1 Cell wall-associated hydrolase, NlpC family [Actinacidiphila bryophytorum]
MASHSPTRTLRRKRPASTGSGTRTTRTTPRTTRTTARIGVTLALASAASVSLFGETGHAAPELTPDQVKAKVAALYEQAEQATEDYNGAKEQADTASSAVSALQDELARKTDQLNATRDALGTIAAAQYRTGGVDPLLQLALSSTPDTYLARASYLDQAGGRQSQALARLAAQQQDIAVTRAQAAGKLAALRDAQAAVADHKRTVNAKLAAAQALLAQLTAAQRAAVAASDGPAPASGTPASATRDTARVPLAPVTAPSSRAARAVAFAYRAIGLPYVWGATGPGSYDCSGLTQAAWRAAGVSLPRTTYTQINAGTRVSRSQLQPGDLVFFYSGVSHVGLYVGGGQMIHAPHPGSTVRIAPISEMPFAGAVRPG